MDNLDIGLTGTRTDTIVISCWQNYLSFPRAARHMETLHRRYIYRGYLQIAACDLIRTAYTYPPTAKSPPTAM